MSDQHFMTTEEVLEYLKVNLRTVYRLVKAKKLPAIRVGRQWRFRRGDVDAYLSRSESSTERRRKVLTDRRVLVVEDEEAVGKLIVKSLVDQGYTVDLAAGGNDAIDFLKCSPYDLVITDLRMPAMDGLSVIRRIRQQLSAAELPIVVITGYSTEANAIEALNLGVARYLTKPIRMPKVVAAAKEVLASSGLAGKSRALEK